MFFMPLKLACLAPNSRCPKPQNRYIFVEVPFHSLWIPVVEIQSCLLGNAVFQKALDSSPYGLRAMEKVSRYFQRERGGAGGR